MAPLTYNQIFAISVSNHSVLGYQPPLKNTPLFLAKNPLLNLQTVQAPLFYAISSFYISFS